MVVIFKRAVIALALFCLIIFFHEYSDSLKYLFEETSSSLFIMSIVTGCFSSLLLANVFKKEIELEHKNVNKKQLIYIYYVGQIAKYVPGKVWGILYQSSSLKEQVPISIVLKANYYLMVFSLVATSCVSGVSLSIIGNYLWALGILILSLLGFVLINIYTSWFLIKFNRFKLMSSIVGAFSKRQRLSTQFIDLFSFILLNTVTFILFFLSVGIDIYLSMEHIANYTIAWVAGGITFLFPAGAGVRELIFVSLSDESQTQITGLISIAIYMRVWQMIQDLIGFLLSIIYFKLD